MKLNSVAIRAFRSLFDVELAPGSLTVLVGPNNAGKSNLADALDFLAETHEHGLEMAVRRKGGYENIAHRRMRRTRHAIEFVVRSELPYSEVPFFYRDGVRLRDARRLSGLDGPPVMQICHSFGLRAASQSIRADFFVASETIEVSASDRTGKSIPLAEITRSGDSLRFVGGRRRIYQDPEWKRVIEPFFETGFDNFVRSELKPTELLTRLLAFNGIMREYQVGLAAMRIFQLVPLECRRPGAPTPNAEVDRHGSNLPALVAYLKENHRDAWVSVLKSMRQIVPGLRDIRTEVTPERTLALQFVEDQVGRPWAAHEISDGTIQSLALFSAIHDPRIPFLLIEEPENSVHPWIVRVFVDACRDAGKQIIVTTHSPALLSYVRPDEVALVWRHEGKSHLARLPELNPEVVELWDSGSTSLYDLIDSGWLRQAVPPGYA